MLELLKLLQKSNIRLEVNNGKLKIDAPKGAMTPAVMGQLKEHKDRLVDYLGASQVKQSVITKADRNAPLPLSFAQQRLWFIDQMVGGSAQYNIATAIRFAGKFKEAVVEQAFNRIINRHEPLRTVFVDSGVGVAQQIRADVRFELTLVDLSDLAADLAVKKLQAIAEADAVQLYDLENDLMLRSTFIRLSKDSGALLLNMHHIASDGWSMGLLVNEFW